MLPRWHYLATCLSITKLRTLFLAFWSEFYPFALFMLDIWNSAGPHTPQIQILCVVSFKTLTSQNHLAREFTAPALCPCSGAVWAPEQSPVCPFECQTSEIFPQLLITPLLQDAIVTHLSPQKVTLHPSSTLCLDAKEDTWRVSCFFSWNFKRCKAICFKPLPILMTSLFRCVLSVGTAACHTASHQIFRVTQKPLSYSISVNSHQHRKGHRPQPFTFEFVIKPFLWGC